MKTLDQLSVNDTAVIACITAEEDLKQRFFSFGMRRGSPFKIKAISMSKSTIEIEVGGTMIALRRDEAEAIKVNKICEL